MKKGWGALKLMYKSPYSCGIFHSAPSVLFAAGTLALQGRSSLHIWALFLTVLLASQAHCLLLLLMDHWYDQHHLRCPQYDALACASVFPLVLSPLSFFSLMFLFPLISPFVVLLPSLSFLFLSVLFPSVFCFAALAIVGISLFLVYIFPILLSLFFFFSLCFNFSFSFHSCLSLSFLSFPSAVFSLRISFCSCSWNCRCSCNSKYFSL